MVLLKVLNINRRFFVININELKDFEHCSISVAKKSDASVVKPEEWPQDHGGCHRIERLKIA